MLGRLKELQGLNKNIKIALLGAGSMGKGIFYQSSITPGIDCLAVADVKVERAIDSVKSTGQDFRIVENKQDLSDCIKKNTVAVCQDGMLLAECDYFDAFLDASNSMISAALIDIKALSNNMHLIMMNAEADLLYGPYLMSIAKQNGLIYTSSDGDQPGAIKRIADEIKLWGFELVMAGNIKGFLDRYSNPTKIIPEANKRNLDYIMCTSYTDGTKVAIENALVANALNCRAIEPRLNGNRMESVFDIFDHYDFESLHNKNERIVDYILGAYPKGGVFVVGYCPNEYQQSMLDWFPSSAMGKKRFNLFYRPYHLCHIETMRTVAEAVLDHKALLTPKYGFKTNVYAYAKKNIKKGDTLDGLGGYTCYGLLENNDNEKNLGLPICLAHDVLVSRDIGIDEKIFMSDIINDPERVDFKLYNKAISANI